MVSRLTRDAFLATLDAPMRFIHEEDDSVPPVQIGEYFQECVDRENLPTNREDVAIHGVYANPKQDYCHLLLNWGVKNLFLVIVTQPQQQQVFGHYLLDLNTEYGLYNDTA